MNYCLLINNFIQINRRRYCLLSFITYSSLISYQLLFTLHLRWTPGCSATLLSQCMNLPTPLLISGHYKSVFDYICFSSGGYGGVVEGVAATCCSWDLFTCFILNDLLKSMLKAFRTQPCKFDGKKKRANEQAWCVKANQFQTQRCKNKFSWLQQEKRKTIKTRKVSYVVFLSWLYF